MLSHCWAARLGGCSTTRSREHLISKSLFESSTIKVQGFSWCLGEPREISLERFTSKILCTTHNNALSAVDQEGQHAFITLRTMQRVMNERRSAPLRPWPIKRYQLNGLLLERWFLKTTINLCHVVPGEIRWMGGDRDRTQPPKLLVEAIFGVANLPSPMGLYTATQVGETIYSDDTVAFVPLLRSQGEVMAGLFHFRGWRFLVSLVEEPFPEILSLPTTGPQHPWRRSELNYHLPTIEHAHGSFTSQILQFNWEQRKQ